MNKLTTSMSANTLEWPQIYIQYFQNWTKKNLSFSSEIPTQHLRWLPGLPLIKSQSRSFEKSVQLIFKIHLNYICFVKVQILAHVSVVLIPCSCPFSTSEKFLAWEISELEICRHISGDTILATISVTGGTTCEHPDE